jgi:serine/threonine-protein kinase HipA
VESGTKPQLFLRLVLRERILNIAMGNVDNHCRNTAIIKYATGEVMLSPLYDFAPMFLSPSGISREGYALGERKADADARLGTYSNIP